MARCARGEHQIETNYGTAGIIMAILFFPFGLACLKSNSGLSFAKRLLAIM